MSSKTDKHGCKGKCLFEGTMLQTRETVAILELESNNRKLQNVALEQYGRRNILRVSGIPKSENEDTDDIIHHLASDIGVPMSSSDIQITPPRKAGG